MLTALPFKLFEYSEIKTLYLFISILHTDYFIIHTAYFIPGEGNPPVLALLGDNDELA